MSQLSKRIMIVTGEASGDLHGSKLIKYVKALSPETTFFGVGGHRMAEAGCDILIPGEELAVMGIVEIAGHFPLIWRSFQRLKALLQGADKPDALVLIDFPEFNLRLAKQAKMAGVPVLYYVSPQVWAWRRGRVKKIAGVVDSLAAIFPFEPELYNGLDINVEYVGHPLLDEFGEDEAASKAGSLFESPAGKKVVGVFPGSRKNELRYMLDTLTATVERFYREQPDVQFLVPVAAGLDEDEIKRRFPKGLQITFVSSAQTSIYDIARSCDAIVTVSGTVTLQIALAGTPMVIIYKLSPLSYEIGKRLVKVDHIGLANIVAGKRVVQELIQDDATPEAVVEELSKLLRDLDYAKTVRNELSAVRNKLGKPGCSDRVANMLMNMISTSQERLHV